MTTNLVVLQKTEYLHAIISGQNIMEDIAQSIKKIRCECVTLNYRIVLIEVNFDDKPLGIFNVLEIVRNESLKNYGFFKAIAYVSSKADVGFLKFIEDFAVNRGFPFRAFSNTTDAEEWIQHRTHTMLL